MAQLLCVRNNNHRHDLPDATAKKRDMLHRRGDVVSIKEDGESFGRLTHQDPDDWTSPPVDHENHVIIDIPGVAAEVFARLTDGVKHSGDDVTVARKGRYLNFSLLPTPKRTQLNSTHRVTLTRARILDIVAVRPLHRPDHDALRDTGI